MIAEYGWDDEKFFWYTETWMTEAEYKRSVLSLGMSTLRVSTRSEPSKINVIVCQIIIASLQWVVQPV